MLSSYTDQLRSDDVKTVPDDEGNDGPSSFETPEMTYTTEFITMQSITGIVHSKMRILSLFIYTPLCRSKTIIFFLMKISVTFNYLNK